MPAFFDHYRATQSLSRRCQSGALLVAYLLTATGIPLPAGPRPVSGEAYPCADHACGCDTAEQCWRSCCCFTMLERFAWARQHGVRPPEFAIAAARESVIDLAWLGIPLKSDSSCCHAEADRHEVAANSTGSCCRAKASCCESKKRTCCAHKKDDQTAQKADKKEKSNRVVAWQALGCHGHSLNWPAAVPSLVFARPVTSDEVVLVDWLGPALSDVARPICFPPAVPPPEHA